jgi:hypothetical protein
VALFSEKRAGQTERGRRLVSPKRSQSAIRCPAAGGTAVYWRVKWSENGQKNAENGCFAGATKMKPAKWAVSGVFCYLCRRFSFSRHLLSYTKHELFQ